MMMDMKTGLWVPKQHLCSLFPGAHGYAATAGFQAAPVIESTALTIIGADNTNHAVVMPSGVQSGDRLLIVFACGGGTDGIPTGPSGWTELFKKRRNLSNGSAYWKTSNGGEGANEVVTTADTVQSASVAFRITGHADQAVEVFANTAINSAPNPGFLNPTWGIENVRWIAAIMTVEKRTFTGYPAGYGNGQTGHTNDLDPEDATVATADIAKVIGTENPGAFTMTGGTVDHTHAIIGIRPLA